MCLLALAKFALQTKECSSCRIAQAVKKAEESQRSASEALQKSAALQGQVDVLQKALQKAEERTAKLEFQVSCTSNSLQHTLESFCINGGGRP